MSNPNNSFFNPLALNLFTKSVAGKSVIGKNFSTIAWYLGIALLITGCASTSVTTSPEIAANEQLPRPGRILVYDFVPATSGQAGSDASEQAKIGREIASGVVNGIRDMGLSAEEASPSTMMQINDIVIKGYVVSVDEGNVAKRVSIGFGSGASELKVQVEGYQVTPRGLRKIGGGTGDAGGGKSPGAALGVAGAIATANPAGLIISTGMKVYGEASGSSKVEGRTKQIVEEISDRLRTRFQEQGWIQ